MTNQIQTVNFHNQTIITLQKGNVAYVAMKPICENIGLDWDSQRKRIERDEVLNSTKVIMTVVAQDNKIREMLCLPIQYLNGWLFGVDVSRVKSEIKDKIIMYKKECFEVLFNYWNKGQSTKTNAHQRQALVTACDKLAVGNTLRSDIYKMVGNQFGVDDIQSIPMHQLADATAFVYEIILAKQQTPKTTPDLSQQTIECLASQFAKTAILINHVKNEYLPFLYTANFAKAEKVSVHLALINYDIQDNCQDLFKLLPSEIKNDNAHPIVSELQTAYYHDNLLKCPQKIA